MRYIYKIWHENPRHGKAEAEKRIGSETAFRTGLTIRPMNQAEEYELYYMPTNEIMLLSEKIVQQDKELVWYENTLPDIAKTNFFIDLLSDELQKTNEIEGVWSNKKDIVESTNSIMKSLPNKRDRMQSMIISYLELSKNTLTVPQKHADIRKIYDHITQGEIEDKSLPDGVFFRKGGTDVSNSVGKVIHTGIYPEERIIEHVDALLDFLHAAELPQLIKTVIAHYYFGYIHPFYDGNGRTSRFITSLALSKQFGLYTSYSLARGCSLLHKEYLEIFDITNKFNNFGEMNCFIDGFLAIIYNGQQDVKRQLEYTKELLERAEVKIQMLTAEIKDDKRLMANLLYILAQYHLFSFDKKGMSRKELTDIVKDATTASQVAIHKCLQDLENQELILLSSKRPIIYRLNPKVLES